MGMASWKNSKQLTLSILCGWLILVHIPLDFIGIWFIEWDDSVFQWAHTVLDSRAKPLWSSENHQESEMHSKNSKNHRMWNRKTKTTRRTRAIAEFNAFTCLRGLTGMNGWPTIGNKFGGNYFLAHSAQLRVFINFMVDRNWPIRSMPGNRISTSYVAFSQMHGFTHAK